MLYADKSKTKIIRALVVISVLVVFTVIGSTQHAAYYRDIDLNKFALIVKKDLNSFFYKLQFNQTSSGLTAAVGAAFSSDNGPDAFTYVAKGKALSVPVLVYHGIVTNPDRFSMTPDRFKDQMLALKKAGFQTISIEDFLAYIKGKKDLPDKSFLLTFDDGRKDSYYGADPILRAAGFKAVMFVATSMSLPDVQSKVSTYYLNDLELQRMLSSQYWQIQSHAVQTGGGFVPIDAIGTQGNFLSNKMWISSKGRVENQSEYEARVRAELTNSKLDIQNKLGESVVALSYPFGDYGQQSVNASDISATVINKYISQNYQLAFQQVWPIDNGYSQNYPDNDSFHIKRIEPSPAWNGEELVSWLSFGRVKDLAYDDTFTKNNGWKSAWGGISVNNDSLNSYATETTSGSYAFLDGTYFWNNYVYTANLDWLRGGFVSLIARYKDNDNYTECTFTDDKIIIDRLFNGAMERVAETKNIYEISKENLNLSVGVNQKSVYCILNGNIVLSKDDIPNIPTNGGIGFKTWDPVLNNTAIRVKDVHVLPVNANFADQIASLPVSELVPKEGTTPKPTPKPTTTPTTPTPTVKSITPITLSPSTPYYVTDFTKIPAWKNIWGALSSSAAGIMIGATPTSTGGFAVLQGGSAWTDYELMVRPKSLGGSSFSLVSRYADNGDYVSCTYTNIGRGSVRLDTVIGGVSHQIGATMSLSRYAGTDWSNLPFTMQVFGDTVTCTANNEDAIHLTVPTMPASGGIGIKTWSKNNNGSQIIVKELRVTSLY